MATIKLGEWGSLLCPRGASECIDEGNLRFDPDGPRTVVVHPAHGGRAPVNIDASNLVTFTIQQRGSGLFRHYRGTGIPNAHGVIDAFEPRSGSYTLSNTPTAQKHVDQVGDGDWIPSNPPSGKKP